MRMEDIIVGMFFVLAAFAGFMTYKDYKKSKRATQNALKRYGATMTATLRHIDGLPLLHDVYVNVYYGPEKILFITEKKEISIARSKITDIEWRQRRMMRHSLFGKGIGIVLWLDKISDTCLVISYTSDGYDRYIMLDTRGKNRFALKMQKDFKQQDTSGRRSIEL